MSNNYKIILQAAIDEKSLQKQVDTLSGKYKINIGVKTDSKAVDSLGKQVKNLKKNVGSGVEVVSKTATKNTSATRKSVDNLTKSVKKSGKAIKSSKDQTMSWGSQMKIAMERTIQWGISMGIIYGALSKIKDGIQYVRDLNKELTNIRVLQVEGAKTAEDVKNLAVDYNDLAKEMGATTIEVAQGSVEWLRQGKSIEETKELLKSTLMLAKLGNTETAEATEYLTSVLNGFQKEASDSIDVVNKLVAVDNVAATSVKELAIGLQRSSASAQQAGVSFEALVSWIGTVSSVTRRSASSIGVSFPV